MSDTGGPLAQDGPINQPEHFAGDDDHEDLPPVPQEWTDAMAAYIEAGKS